MRVIRAKHAGVCYGVTRACDMALSALGKSGQACTLGPLIHNPQVVADLEKRGIHAVHTIDDVDFPVVIIRSHGITPDLRHALEEKGVDIVDATCPHVALAQRAAADLAKDNGHVIVVGEAGHPEVEGLCACVREAHGTFDVVGSAQDLPDDIPDRVGVVVQTTQMHETLDDITSELVRRGITFDVRDTICHATTERQQAAADLARIAQAMVVIGGRNSSNTTRLSEICRLYCDHVFHIESADELAQYADVLTACDIVGVTAGASTPEDQIDDVVSYLEGLN